jgi:nodulation protein E
MRHGVSITGLGSISALGHGVPELLASLTAGRCGIGPIATIDATRLAVPIAGEISDFDPMQHFDRRQILLLDRASQFALVAAREAMSGIDVTALDRERCGVILGAAIGQTTLDAAYLSLYAQDAARLPPLTVPRGMPSAAASHVAMAYGMLGPCFAVASACASAAHAIALAAGMIRTGQLDLVICGGADASICLGYLKAWDALRVLSADACRPFSRDRSGLVIGEGAGILVLESVRHADARGATIHAACLGAGIGADAGDITAPSAEGAARAIRAALLDADLAPEDVDYVNAHGTATRLNDRAESAALHAVFGAHISRLAVSSSKSMHGHCLNAAGGLEAVVSVLALRESLLPPTLGFQQADPECDLDCVPNIARRAEIRVALSNSFAFGGLNAVLAFGRAA